MVPVVDSCQTGPNHEEHSTKHDLIITLHTMQPTPLCHVFLEGALVKGLDACCVQRLQPSSLQQPNCTNSRVLYNVQDIVCKILFAAAARVSQPTKIHDCLTAQARCVCCTHFQNHPPPPFPTPAPPGFLNQPHPRERDRLQT